MIRTQVYITEKEKKMLGEISKQTQKTRSELIRDAIALLYQSKKRKLGDFETTLKATAGSWKNNDFDFATLRKKQRKFD